MTPLRDRILGALMLQPMSITELAKALSVHRHSAYLAAQDLKASGVVHELRAVRTRKYGRPTVRLAA